MEKIEEGFLSAESELPIDDEASAYMMETTKWARFITITFYIIIVLVLFLVLTQGSSILYLFSSLALFSERLTLVLIISGVVVVAFITAYFYLLNFANKVKTGIDMQDIGVVNEGLRSLNNHLIILAILSGTTILYTLFVMIL